MKHKNEHGFVEVIVIVVILIVVIIGGFIFWNNSKNNSEEATPNYSELTDEEISQLSDEEFNELKETAQRDSTRKTNIGQIIAAASGYQSDNGGSTPNIDQVKNDDINISSYSSGEFVDPSSGSAYEFVENDPEIGQIQYLKGSSCTDTYGVQSESSDRYFVFRTKLESGEYYCI